MVEPLLSVPALKVLQDYDAVKLHRKIGSKIASCMATLEASQDCPMTFRGRLGICRHKLHDESESCVLTFPAPSMPITNVKAEINKSSNKKCLTLTGLPVFKLQVLFTHET